MPLMLSSFSMMCMLFVDRLFLAYYSTTALTAAVNAATLGWAFAYSGMILTNIAEVFVAQYNGAGLKQKMGEPVWQMIWLSAASCAFFFPLAFWGSEWIYGATPIMEMEREYFKWMMLFGPSVLMYGALCSFFIGQGKTALITLLAIFANVLNAGLDAVLIFGVEGMVPSLGITGAAIATNGSTVFQVMILAYIFLNKNHRTHYKTNTCAFKVKPFLQCLRVGFPNALFVGFELLGWASYYGLMTMVGEKHITLVGICQSVAILFYFFAEGLSKGAATVAGNLIGAGKPHLVPRVMQAGIKLNFIFFGFLILIYAGFKDLIIAQFLGAPNDTITQSYYDSLSICLLLMICYMLFEGMRLLIAGLLTAAGDTFFLLLAGSTSVWVMLVLPVYLIVAQYGAAVEFASTICVIYSLLASALYFWRFYIGRWKTISLTN